MYNIFYLLNVPIFFLRLFTYRVSGTGQYGRWGLQIGVCYQRTDTGAGNRRYGGRYGQFIQPEFGGHPLKRVRIGKVLKDLLTFNKFGLEEKRNVQQCTLFFLTCRHFAKVIQKFHRARPRSVNLDSICLDIATCTIFNSSAYTRNAYYQMPLYDFVKKYNTITIFYSLIVCILSIQPPLTAANTMLQRFAIDIVTVQETTYIGFIDDLDL